MKRQKRNYKMTTSTELDYMKVIKIGIGVILALGIVLLVTKLAMGEIKLGKKGKTKEETIMAGEALNRKASKYYVFFMNFTDKYATYYLQSIANYKASNNEFAFYTVDIEKKMNTDYATNTLKVTNPTILKIVDSNIVETISGEEAVMNFLK